MHAGKHRSRFLLHHLLVRQQDGRGYLGRAQGDELLECLFSSKGTSFFIGWLLDSFVFYNHYCPNKILN